ncbi:MAG: hypothetical protein Q8N90_03385 [bacterium]|nr:hypothetical protein [bacterium]
MKFECFSSVTFFKEKTTLSRIPTIIEPNVWFIPVVMLYDENYIGKETFVQNSTLMKVFIGENCLIENSEIVRSSIKNDSGIDGASVIDSEIDERAMIGRGTVIDDAIIGANAHLSHACHVAHCIIGQNTVVSSGVCLNNYSSHGSELIDIGEKCFIGANVIINSSCLVGNEVYISDGAILSHDAHIPDHAWIAGYGCDCYAKPNCSFYLGRGLWIVTKKPTDLKLMEEINEEFRLYDTTVAFHCRLQKDSGHEWLTSIHPCLNNFRPIDLLKEEAQYENTTGAIALKKLIRQEIESLSLDGSSLPQ